MGELIDSGRRNDETLENLKTQGRDILKYAFDGTIEIFAESGTFPMNEVVSVWSETYDDIRRFKTEVDKANSDSWAMLKSIRNEVAPILKAREEALANGHNPAKRYEG
jgi:hypothetical protein